MHTITYLVEHGRDAVEAALTVLVDGRQISRHDEFGDGDGLDKQGTVGRRQNNEVAFGWLRSCPIAAVAGWHLTHITDQFHFKDRRLQCTATAVQHGEE